MAGVCSFNVLRERNLTRLTGHVTARSRRRDYIFLCKGICPYYFVCVYVCARVHVHIIFDVPSDGEVIRDSKMLSFDAKECYIPPTSSFA